MTALRGIGPWTADIYLLFCVGHPDIFPAVTSHCRSAFNRVFGCDPARTKKKLRKIAEKWMPWRGIAARLFWSYSRKRRETAKIVFDE